MRRWFITLGLCVSATAARADDIFEEHHSSATNVNVPTSAPLNPAANPTSAAIINVGQDRRDETIDFKINPGTNESNVAEKIGHKDIFLGGQYPLGGAAMGLQYSEQERRVTSKIDGQQDPHHELFVGRDYRMIFSVDFTPQIRGAFTFHYTALKADLDGSYFVGSDDRTHYHGSMSGYGLGVVYDKLIFEPLSVGLFTHPPMRGKATVEGEQKIITEPGLYGLDIDYRKDRFAGTFFVNRWSYKHDEREYPSTSPHNQTDILLRGLDLSQYYRKTAAYGLAGEYQVHPFVFIKGQYKRQQGVFLFDPDKLPGDDKSLETEISYSEYRLAVAGKNRQFIAEFGLSQSKASEGDIKGGRAGFGDLGSYEDKITGVYLMLGAAF